MHDDVDLVGAVATELGEEAADPLGILLGVAKIGLPWAASIRADDDGVGRHVGRGRLGERGAGDRSGCQGEEEGAEHEDLSGFVL